MRNVGPRLRWKFYYDVPRAGDKVGWSRSESYRRAERGEMPTERDGKLLLVPRKRWDRKVKNLLRELAKAR